MAHGSDRDPADGVGRVRWLACYAGLPLAPGREPAVAAILDAWVPEANALSRKMSEAAHRDLLPATVFAHPAADADQAER